MFKASFFNNFVVIFFLALFNCSSAYSLLNHAAYLELEPFSARATDTLLTNSIFAVKVADPIILGDFKKQYFQDLENAWGARIALGYDFMTWCNHTDGLSLEYTFFNHTNNDFIRNDNRDHVGHPVLAPAEFIDITDEASARFSEAKTSLQQNYDTIDLLGHRYIRLNHCSSINILGGIRYFHLQEKLHNRYDFDGFIDNVLVRNIYDVRFENDLNAIGPHIGSQVYYHLVYGFGITGQLTASLLYGESYSEFHNSYNLLPNGTTSFGTTTSLTSSNHHDDTCHVVPALSGKIAIAYRQCLSNCTYVSVELGYRGDKYFRAANDVAYQQLLAGDDINSNSNYQDFDLSGPYLCFAWHS